MWGKKRRKQLNLKNDFNFWVTENVLILFIALFQLRNNIVFESGIM